MGRRYVRFRKYILFLMWCFFNNSCFSQLPQIMKTKIHVTIKRVPAHPEQGISVYVIEVYISNYYNDRQSPNFYLNIPLGSSERFNVITRHVIDILIKFYEVNRHRSVGNVPFKQVLMGSDMNLARQRFYTADQGDALRGPRDILCYPVYNVVDNVTKYHNNPNCRYYSCLNNIFDSVMRSNVIPWDGEDRPIEFYEVNRYISLEKFLFKQELMASDRDLAWQGFHTADQGHALRCAWCRSFYPYRIKSDDVAAVHRRLAPHCPMVTGTGPTGNVLDLPKPDLPYK